VIYRNTILPKNCISSIKSSQKALPENFFELFSKKIKKNPQVPQNAAVTRFRMREKVGKDPIRLQKGSRK